MDRPLHTHELQRKHPAILDLCSPPITGAHLYNPNQDSVATLQPYRNLSSGLRFPGSFSRNSGSSSCVPANPAAPASSRMLLRPVAEPLRSLDLAFPVCHLKKSSNCLGAILARCSSRDLRLILPASAQLVYHSNFPTVVRTGTARWGPPFR